MAGCVNILIILASEEGFISTTTSYLLQRSNKNKHNKYYKYKTKKKGERKKKENKQFYITYLWCY